MIRKGFHVAETEEEKHAVYRLRYDVYVEEMGRYRGAADHERRLLVEPEDQTARIFYAAPDGEVIATSRLSWGGDARYLIPIVNVIEWAAVARAIMLEAVASATDQRTRQPRQEPERC